MKSLEFRYVPIIFIWPYLWTYFFKISSKILLIIVGKIDKKAVGKHNYSFFVKLKNIQQENTFHGVKRQVKYNSHSSFKAKRSNYSKNIGVLHQKSKRQNFSENNGNLENITLENILLHVWNAWFNCMVQCMFQNVIISPEFLKNPKPCY